MSNSGLNGVDDQIRKSARIRTRVIMAGLILWTAGIIVRLVQLQIFPMPGPERSDVSKPRAGADSPGTGFDL